MSWSSGGFAPDYFPDYFLNGSSGGGIFGNMAAVILAGSAMTGTLSGSSTPPEGEVGTGDGDGDGSGGRKRAEFLLEWRKRNEEHRQRALRLLRKAKKRKKVIRQGAPLDDLLAKVAYSSPDLFVGIEGILEGKRVKTLSKDLLIDLSREIEEDDDLVEVLIMLLAHI